MLQRMDRFVSCFLFLLSSPPVHLFYDSLGKVTAGIYSLPLHRPFPFLFVPAVAVGSAGSQDPKDLPVSGLFIRERMKAVQRQNDVKGAVRIRKCTHIPLPEGHIFQVQAVCLFQTSSGTRAPQQSGSANSPFYKKPLLSGPSAKIIRPAVFSVKKFRHFSES